MKIILWSLVGSTLFFQPFLVPSVFAGAETVRGKVEREGVLLFTYERVAKDGNVHQSYFDPAGKRVSEEAVSLQGDEVQTYTFEDFRRGLKGKMERKASEIHWEFTENGETRHDKSGVESHLTVGPVMLRFVEKHWDELLKGETISIRLAVLDRMETVGFTMKHDATQSGTVRMSMVATSFFIRLIAPRVEFDFDLNTKKLKQVRGPTLLKIQDKGEWKQLEAITTILSHQ